MVSTSLNKHGHVDVVKFLIEYQSAILYAAKHGKTKIIYELLKHKVDVDYQDERGDITIYIADKKSLLQLIDEHGIDKLNNILDNYLLTLTEENGYYVEEFQCKRRSAPKIINKRWTEKESLDCSCSILHFREKCKIKHWFFKPKIKLIPCLQSNEHN